MLSLLSDKSKDNEVSSEELKESHLAILGNPSTNLILSQLKDKLPIKIGDKVICVSNRTYKGENIGAVMLIPNPFNEKKFAFIWCAFVPSIMKMVVLHPSCDEDAFEPQVDYLVMTFNLQTQEIATS